MAALPSEENDRPYVAEAEYALAKILHVYDLGNTMSYDRTLDHDLTVYDMRLDTDRKYLAVRDSVYSVYVYDTETWERKIKIPAKLGRYGYSMSVSDQLADETGVFIGCDESFCKYDFDGNEIFTYEAEGYVRGLYAVGDILYVATDSGITRLDKKSGALLGTTDVPEGKLYSRSNISSNSRYICTTNMPEDSDRTQLAVYDIANDCFTVIRPKEEFPMEYCFTPSGNIATLSCNDNFISDGLKEIVLDVFDIATGRKLASTVVDAHIRNLSTFDSKLKAHTYEVDGEEKAEIVVAVEGEAFNYNEKDLKLLQSMTLPGEVVQLALRSDNSIGFASLDNGKIETIDFAEGRIYADNTIVTEKPIRDVLIMNGVVVIRSAYSSTINVMKYHQAADINEIDMGTGYISVVCKPDENDRFLAKCASNYIVYSGDGEYLFDFKLDNEFTKVAGTRGDEFILFTTDYMDEVGSESVATSLSDMGITEYISRFVLTSNGRYAAAWGTRYFVVIDTIEKKKLFEANTDSKVGNVAVSESGDAVYVSLADKDLIRVDLNAGEDMEYENSDLRSSGDYNSLDYLKVSHDGKTIAMCCGDSMLRLVDTATGSVMDEVPMYTKQRCGIYFSEDDRKLIIQGDDLKVKIRDIASKSYVNAFDVSYTIKNVTESADFIALQDGVNEYLIEKSGYGLCTMADYGLAYLPGHKNFVISRIKTLYMCPYKDYKQLLAEAAVQFPNASLTEEEKVKYNVN